MSTVKIPTVTSVAPLRGGDALLGEFLRPGECWLPEGSIVVECDFLGYARVRVVAYDGSLIALRGKDGRSLWLHLGSRS
ncbi:MAG: hypothetical protein QME77_11780 [bacterium]|nr:hypothetical protein [bacterium]